MREFAKISTKNIIFYLVGNKEVEHLMSLICLFVLNNVVKL